MRGYVLLCAGALMVMHMPSEGAVDIAADNPNIQYFGRIDASNPKKPRFDWPGTGIRARFSGTSVTVKISGGDNDFNVVIDGQVKSKLSMRAGTASYLAAQGLSAGEHTLVLHKRTEGFNGIAVFEGLQLPDGGALLAPPPRPARKIQFIGDSYTVGYGAGATVLNCPDRRPFDDNYVAYGPVTAREVDAEFSVQAVSGLGMVHNYGDASALSARPMPSYYEQTLFGADGLKWDFSKWVPDLILIALGTNDFSTAVKPTQAQYTSAYKEFIKKVRSFHPQSRILCLTFSADEFQGRYVEALVKELAELGDGKVHWSHMPALNTGELGCDYHPNTAGHRKFADVLVPVVEQYLGGTGLHRQGKSAESSPGPARPDPGKIGSIPFPDAGKKGWVDSRGRSLDP